MLPTTLTLESAIAAPAMTGLRMPSAASGIPTDVVDERPEQVLADLRAGAARDVERGGHQPRIAAHERDARGVHGDVRAAAHGDPEVGRSERRGVVHAVAHHGDP